MKRSTGTKLLALLLCANIGLVAPQVALAEDIDIFLGTSGGDSLNPRILIVLDNTSNWSRQSQGWPGGKTQGESEVAAISTVINTFKVNGNDPAAKTISAGLMEFVTEGDANDDGGFVRSHIRELSPDNVNKFDAQLAMIGGDINGTKEKRNSNTPYGNLMFDIYNYFAGANSHSGHATNAVRADEDGYTAAYSQFKSPLTADNTCGRSFVVFISNPNSSGPTADNVDNSNRLKALNGGVLPPQIKLPNFTSKSVSTPGVVGVTASCHATPVLAASELTSTTFAPKCAAYTDGCKIGPVTVNDGAAVCAAGQSKYQVIGTDTVITNVATSTTTTDSKPYNADEWVRLMHDKGIPIPGTTATRSKVTTYTIDVHNKQPSAEHTSLLLSMAKVGGGRYFKASSEKAIVDALREIMLEIQAVNSSFASTSLPVNATNRSQNLNQVFIGMFRPDPASRPRWFGNLKRFQLIKSGSDIKLADVNGVEAVNPLTGFVTPCAKSYWTRDSGPYWQNKGVSPDPAGGCELNGISAYSDVPDGPFVEKGGAAQVTREGNGGAGSAVTQAVTRKMLTLTANGLEPITAANTGLDADLVKWIRGEDVYDEKGTGEKTLTRPTIHGDVIHSRPQPVNYGGANPAISVYYGSNDGTLRSVDAETGIERWSFVAPEFFSRLTRIRDNTTRVHFPDIAAGFLPTPTRKDYFFDGSIGVFQNADNSKVWIFPSMRRGGRMLYGIDVTKKDAPEFKWRAGCPNLNNDTGCTNGMSGIGQTWSTPNVAFIRGYSATKPVVVVGGGYDKCEDGDTATPSCADGKGGFVYVLDADTGERLRAFQTERAIASDIAMIDITNDGAPDYAYAADTGGNIYRFDFSSPTAAVQPGPTEWTQRKVAFTSGGGRKFLHAPTIVYSKDHIYLAIGSGDREHPLRGDYPYENVVNRFYVYRDSLAAPAGTDAKNLDTMADYTSKDACDTPPILPGSGLDGWFMTLNQNGKGEQTVTSGLIVAGMVTFSTNRPVPKLQGSCSTILGEARGYWVNLLNAAGAIGVKGACGGKRSSAFVGGGLPATAVYTGAVMIDNQLTGVVLGAPSKNSDGTGPTDKDSTLGADEAKPGVLLVRKRAYTYTKGQ